MKTSITDILAKCVLIFLIGIAMAVILGKIEILNGSVWKDFLVGASAVLLAEVFFNFKNGRKKGDD
ncbi:hypothetical protein [Paraburkholderia sp. BCC1876]|uniref:hypothetical protein n=1 Tax=Paraburkholderia sp. BCC1876 TaxID=2676303 RepID=UPI0015918A05|nr:hypothetical protein [Paraburkholderia sp. BCC1876]